MLGTATLATRYYSRKVTVTVLSAYVVYSTIYVATVEPRLMDTLRKFCLSFHSLQYLSNLWIVDMTVYAIHVNRWSSY